MYLYNPSLFIAPIQPPQVGPDSVEQSDDRIEVAEVEAAFESFLDELTAQVCQQISPFGKRVSLSSSTDAFQNVANGSSQRPVSTRADLHSPLFNFGDSISLDDELHQLLMSNSNTPVGTRSSSGRLPRRIVGSRTPVTAQSPAAPLLRRTWRSMFASQGGTEDGDHVSQTFDIPRSSSVESHTTTGLREGESNDNFLADEEEAAGVGEDDMNDVEGHH